MKIEIGLEYGFSDIIKKFIQSIRNIITILLTNRCTSKSLPYYEPPKLLGPVLFSGTKSQEYKFISSGVCIISIMLTLLVIYNLYYTSPKIIEQNIFEDNISTQILDSYIEQNFYHHSKDYLGRNFGNVGLLNFNKYILNNIDTQWPSDLLAFESKFNEVD